MGTSDGSIIATIIRIHMPRKVAAAPAQVCPGMRIQAIDIAQPPGIGISPMADIDAHQAIVPVALAANSSADAPMKAGGVRSALVVLVMAAPPQSTFVASQRRAIQPLIHAPQAVETARIGG